MASIIERNGRFLTRVRLDGFKPVSKTFSNKKDALAYGRKVEADMESGRWAAETSRAPSLKEVIKVYRTTVVPRMKGAATYRYRFDEFEALSFANKPVNEVTPADLAAYRDQQSALNKPATVVRKLAMLSSMFSFCLKERGWITLNPVASIRKPRVSDGRSRIMSDDETAYLMAAAMTSKARWLAPALTVLLHSAVRRSELFRLKRCDIDYERAVAHLSDAKAGARDVPLCPRSLSALQELGDEVALNGEDTLLPFGEVASFSTRFKVTVKRARKMYEADCLIANVVPDTEVFRDLRLHDLRHCAVTMWATTGSLSIPELQAISGHRSLACLNRYLNLSATTLAAKLASLTA